MKKAVYAGTFDPFTFGHEDIVDKSKKIFDEIIILVAKSPMKSPLLTVEERVELIKSIFEGEPDIKVESWGGLLVDFAQKNQAEFLIRGLRPTGDFESEFQMAAMNFALAENLETVFLPTHKDYSFLSSSLVKEVFLHGGNVNDFLHPKVIDILEKKRKNGDF